MGLAFVGLVLPELIFGAGHDRPTASIGGGTHRDERSAHVADVETCINLLEGTREAYLDGADLKAYLNGTYNFDADGHVIQPYVYVWLLPENLGNLSVEDFTGGAEYFAHPFQTLGPVGHPVHEEGSSPYKAFAADLEHAQSKHDGFVWAVNYNFHTKKSHKSDGAHFEDEHNKEFIRLLLDGRSDYAGRRFIASCGFAEAGLLGPSEGN